MSIVLTCRLPSGAIIEVHPYVFCMVDFKGAEILSGDDYYIKKAVSLGATSLIEVKKVKRKK